MNTIVMMLMAMLALGAAKTPEIVEAEYHGTLNENAIIGLNLIHDSEKKLHGVYYYKKYLKDIPLEGEFVGARDIVLREHENDGSVRGAFRLHFAEHDARHRFAGDSLLDQEVLVGTWIDAQGTVTYPVYLQMETAWDKGAIESRTLYAGTPELETHAQAFYFAVLKGDKQTASNYVHFPMNINSRPVRKVGSKLEFLRFYDRTFTKEYVACIQQGIPHHMWGNYRGWMIADGAVWFNEQGNVTALNPCRPKPSRF